MKRVLLFIVLILGVSELKAQVDKKNPLIRKQLELVELMDEITDKVRLNDMLYKRIALVSFDYPDYIINDTEAIQIKSRIEGAFALGGYTVVSAPEFKQKPITYVNGTDSNLSITRQNTLERLILDEEKMADVIDKYSLQALLYVQLTYDHITGYQVNLQLVKSRSKELIYSTIINSNPELYSARTSDFMFSGGISLYNSESYLVNKVDVTRGEKFPVGLGELAFSVRQPFNKSHGGYYGFKAGVSFMQLLNLKNDTGFVKFSKVIPNAGLYYSICFLKKTEQPRKYWMEAFQSMSAMISSTLVPCVRQGLVINATDNLSLELDFRYFLLTSNFIKGDNTLQTEKFGYGVNIIYRP